MENPNKRNLTVYIVAAILCIGIIAAFIISLSSHRGQSAKQAQLQSQQQALANSPYADPILKYLPYGAYGYNITPITQTIDGKDTLTLNISVVFYDADYSLDSSQRQAAVQSREKAALDYIKSIGFDPTKYRIVYSVPTQ